MSTIIEIQSILQNLKNVRISYTDIGKALGTKRANISKRANSSSELSLEEIKKLEKYYNVELSDKIVDKKSKQTDDIIKIPYWPELPEELKNPDFSCVTAERKAIEKHWYSKAEDLYIITMVGDALTKYWYPINNGDILIIDTSHDEIRGNGVYFATSRNNTRFWVREMQALINNDIEIKSFAPSGNTTKTFTREELNEVGFKIIGKVIKNVSFRL